MEREASTAFNVDYDVKFSIDQVRAAGSYNCAPTNRESASAQLTILAAAPVVSAESFDIAIIGFLASRAQSNTRDRDPPRFWNRSSAMRAMIDARTTR
jgi:hypothetical protein